MNNNSQYELLIEKQMYLGNINIRWLPVTKRRSKASASRLDADCCSGTIKCRSRHQQSESFCPPFCSFAPPGTYFLTHICFSKFN